MALCDGSDRKQSNVGRSREAVIESISLSPGSRYGYLRWESSTRPTLIKSGIAGETMPTCLLSPRRIAPRFASGKKWQNGQIAQERNPNARLNVLVHVGIRKRFPDLRATQTPSQIP